jgi:hypothetical protein
MCPLVLVLLLANEPTAPDLAFQSTGLVGWEGEGFQRLSPADRPIAVSSADCKGQALLHCLLRVPADGGVLRFTAYVERPATAAADDRLDALLFATGRNLLQRFVRTAQGWEPSPRLLPGRHEYRWDVSDRAGQTLRVALIDDDFRPGCHLRSSGFVFEARDPVERGEFYELMIRLQREHRLPEVFRYETRHFLALTTAEAQFSQRRLQDCERIYALFGDHFRRRGFAVYPPRAKLMVAIFDAQSGFDAYLGRKMSPLITGLYHTGTNRLVTYDYGRNEAFLASVKQTEEELRRIDSQLDRQRYLGRLSRNAQDHRAGANVGTIMHEVAHQLSFNCGLLNREGDVPLWLAEGLACYCEPTADGAWQGIGAPNPNRQRQLAANGGQIKLPLRNLLSWNGGTQAGTALQAYAQSWALFRMLMEERPADLRRYLELIRERRTADHRLTDFQQAFGDVKVVERQYARYLRSLVP